MKEAKTYITTPTGRYTHMHTRMYTHTCTHTKKLDAYFNIVFPLSPLSFISLKKL